MTQKGTLERRRLAGLCRCGKAPASGKKTCGECVAKVVSRNRERMAARKAAGLCRCGKPQMPHATMCPKCAAGHVRESTTTFHRRKAAGLCICGAPPADGKGSCESCLGKRKALTEKRKANGVCITCVWRPAQSGHVTCDSCFEKTRAKGFEIRARYRKAVMGHYGGKCACCGESQDEFLTIDHVNNDGKEHRKAVHALKLYRWLMRQGYPTGFQVLCWNCNLAKHLHGECPHKKTLATR